MSKRKNRKRPYQEDYEPQRNERGEIVGWVCTILEHGEKVGQGYGVTQDIACAAAKREAGR